MYSRKSTANDFLVGVARHDLSLPGPSEHYAETTVATSNSLQQKVFIINHPLSTKISERSSNFTGAGLTPPGAYDDYFLYNISKYNGSVHSFELRMDRAFKSSGNQMSLEMKGSINAQSGFVRSLSPIPSSSSVVLSITISSSTSWTHTIAVYSIKNSNNTSTTIFLHFKTEDINTDATWNSMIKKVQRGIHPIFFYAAKSVTELKLWGAENWESSNFFTTYHLQDALNGSEELKKCVTNLAEINSTQGIICQQGLISLAGCTEFSKTFKHCSKCSSGLALTINWPVDNYPTFNCQETSNCQSDEFRGTDLICRKCDTIHGGKPGCDACTFLNNTFGCLTCKSDFITQLNNLNVPCKKNCLVSERISADGLSCLPCSDINPQCTTCQDNSIYCTTCSPNYTLDINKLICSSTVQCQAPCATCS